MSNQINSKKKNLDNGQKTRNKRHGEAKLEKRRTQHEGQTSKLFRWLCFDYEQQSWISKQKDIVNGLQNLERVCRPYSRKKIALLATPLYDYAQILWGKNRICSHKENMKPANYRYE